MSHLKEIGETYWQHFKCAILFSGVMFRLSIACAIHAIYPEVFKTTASDRLTKLVDEMKRCEDDNP